jgi:two-component system NarL family sensor kinase
MTDPRRRRTTIAAGVLFGIALTEVATAAIAGAASSLDWQELLDLLVVTNATIGLSLAVAGWPIAVHRPGNPVGWLLLGGGCTYPSTAAGIAVLACAADQGWSGPLWRVVATVTNGGWTWALTFFLPLALLLFPDGQLSGRRWRLLAIVPVLNGPLFWVIGTVTPPGISFAVGFHGYLSWSDYYRFAWLEAVAGIGVLISYTGAVVALAVRFRRGSEQIRRQLLWLLLAMLIVLTLFTLDPLLPDSVLTIFTIALVPLSITVAMLRHQLLDIRLVFSRSVLYLLLTAGVVVAYLAMVAVLDQVLRDQIALGSSVLATLLIAVVFNPVRVWLQRIVDRAIYGARQDPVRALAEVGARLGEVGTTSGTGLAGILEALCQVMRFPSAAIVLGGTQIVAYGEAPAALHATPLRQGDERLGELVVGLRSGESRLDPTDERIIDLLAAPIAVAVHAGILAEELRRSRERVISGREEERRRLRRDLHDGLGPVLTGVVLNADAARRLVETNPRRSATLLAELRDQTTGALEDIRRLVYDLRPPALDSMGLVGALREYAVVLSRRADAAPLQVTVDAPEPMAELPAAVEVAAYRIVTEALTNVTRHSSASTAVVTLAVDPDALHVGVHDDGTNVGGGWQPGVGLTSIRERAAELGGRCTIQHDRSGGRVDVYLPLAAAPGKPEAVITLPDGIGAPT